MNELSASTQLQQTLRQAHPGLRRLRLDCLHASGQDAAGSIEPSKLFGIASAPLSCLQDDVLDSLFSFCTTSRRKRISSPVL